MKHESICLHCVTGFNNPGRSKRYCSPECITAAKAAVVVTCVCIHCGKIFESLTGKANYCSRSCEEKHNYKANKDRASRQLEIVMRESNEQEAPRKQRDAATLHPNIDPRWTGSGYMQRQHPSCGGGAA